MLSSAVRFRGGAVHLRAIFNPLVTTSRASSAKLSSSPSCSPAVSFTASPSLPSPLLSSTTATNPGCTLSPSMRRLQFSQQRQSSSHAYSHRSHALSVSPTLLLSSRTTTLRVEAHSSRQVTSPFCAWMQRRNASNAKKGNKGNKAGQGPQRVAGKIREGKGEKEAGSKSKSERRNEKKRSSKGEGIPGKFTFMMNGVTKILDGGPAHGGRTLFDNVSISTYAGAKIGVLGNNGSGKSCLLKIIAGVDDDYEGEARPYTGVKVGYLPQEPVLDETKNVRENILEGVSEKLALAMRQTELEEMLERHDKGEEGVIEADRVNGLRSELVRVSDQVIKSGAEGLDWKVDVAIEALRCPPGDRSVEFLSGGEKRRIALCRLLLSNPDLLLLDEPTNHLDAESVAWLERFLQDYKGTVIAVTHDRYFLDNVAGWMLEIDRGSCFPFRGNYSEWLEAKTKRLLLESKQASAKTKQMQKEFEWIQQNPKGRQAKNKARIANFEDMAAESRKRSPEAGTLCIPPGPRLGNEVVSLENVSHSFDGVQLLKDVSCTIPPGAIVGVIGPNGTGKSTLFRVMYGDLIPDEGKVILGETVQLSHVAQSREDLDPDSTVYDEIAEDEHEITLPNGFEMMMRHYVAAFQFKGSDQSKKVQFLSGGECNRVHLAKMLKSRGNVLLLDEPTNDLDVEVLRNLEDALLDFPGAAVVISHDRYFLDRVCTHIMAFEGEGKVTMFDGCYSEYAKDRTKRLGKGFSTKRPKFRKLKL